MFKKSDLSAIVPLFLVLFIDAIGLGIIFPILNPLYLSQDGILPHATSVEMRNFLYGLTLCMFPIAMFFGTPIFGDLSDQIGRKKILLICLVGVGVSYIFSGVAVALKSVTLLLASRFVAGIFAGSQATAQAAAVDVSAKDKKAENISWILLPASLGFIAGPIVGGIFSDSAIESWFSYSTPLFIAGILAILNAIFLYFGFHETHITKGKVVIKFSRAIEVFAAAFRQKSIRTLSIVFLVFELAWSLYFQAISLYLVESYGYSASFIGGFMSFLGLGFALGFVYAIHMLLKYFKGISIVLASCFVVTIFLFITAITNHVIYIWIVGLPIAITMAVSYSLILSFYSNLADSEHQGWVMGISNAIIAVAWGVSAILTGILQNVLPNFPIYTAAVLMGITFVLMWFYRKGF